jgi:protein-S-isoprenylcysteine O-methyltransferase Ste14
MHPPQVVWYLVAAVAVIWLVAELSRAVARRPEGTRAGWRGELVFRLLVTGGAVGAAAVRARVPGAAIAPAAVFGWLALVVLASGVVLRLWSFRTLGRYFTTVIATSADQPVIDRGPYRVLRHPSYTGLALMVVGIGVFVGDWLSFSILTAAIVGALVLRIRIEEAALLRDLGDAYRDYAATRKRLVPYVW